MALMSVEETKTALTTVKVPKTNYIERIKQNQEFLDREAFNCVPRPPEKSLKQKERLKTPWDFFKSVFKDYKPDNELLLAKCFEFDHSCSKLDKIVK